MKILKEYHEFYRLVQTNDMKQLIALRDELEETEFELQKEIDDLEPFGSTTTHTDLQQTYPIFRAKNAVGAKIHACTVLKNYLDFITGMNK